MNARSFSGDTPSAASRSLRLLGIGPKEPWPVTCGGSEGIHGAIEALTRHFQVTYACPGQPVSAAQAEHYARIGIDYRPVPNEPSERVPDIITATLQGRPFKFHKYSSARAVQSFDATLGALQPDVIVCFHAHTEALGRALAQRRGWKVPIVLREHNVEYEMARSICSSMPALKRLVAEPFLWLTEGEERRMWNRSDCVAFLSEHDLALARSSGISGHFTLVPEGVPIPPRRPVHYPPGPARLLIPFNPEALQSRQNTLTFLREYWQQVSSHPELLDVRLSVTAVNAERLASLSGLSLEAQRELRIDALGFVPSLAPVFESALAVLAPTFFGSGIRKKVLEAMANQVPVIATELDLATCHYFKAGRNILIMGGPQEFVRTVAGLRDDPERWLNLAEAGRTTVEEHASWARFADVMHGEVVALLRRSRGQGHGRPAG